jgi:hypothetical protein
MSKWPEDLSFPLGYGTSFDRALAAIVPAIFLLDADGELRLSLDRTREAWDRLKLLRGPEASPSFAPVHLLLRDRATGWVQYAYVGSIELIQDNPRADILQFPDEHAAISALSQFGRPPIYRGDWPAQIPTP